MFKWFTKSLTCLHSNVRCVHGDEINFLDGTRVVCIDCGKKMKGEPPAYCYYTKDFHNGLS